MTVAVELRAGLKLRSVVDTTEVVVVKGSGEVDLRCGGQPMVAGAPGGAPAAAPAPGLDGGTLLGKRYVAGEGALELLCVKAGDGSLSVGDDVLHLKEAKPLPASD